MKNSVGITRNIIPKNDRQAWFFYVEMLEKRKNTKATDMVEFAEKVCQQFPDLPNKMVWGNYLIPNIDEDFADFSIDYHEPDEIIEFVKQLAKEYGFVAWANAEIFRPDK